MSATLQNSIESPAADAALPCGTTLVSTRRQGGALEISLLGDWRVADGALQPGLPATILASHAAALTFNSDALGRWDTALIAFVAALRTQAIAAGSTVDTAGLPKPALKLLDLCQAAVAITPTPRPGLVSRTGQAVLDAQHEAAEVTALVGNIALRAGAALRGRAMTQGGDVLRCMAEAGPSALIIVGIINVLVGAILAFVGAVQLRRFGADIYVASLVGIAMVREMAALMTAIIMAGRTGGAYAANLATMQGNEELDALRGFGIPLFDYLVLPRIVALTLMMPVLYLWGCAVGILGGFVVASLTLSLSAVSYFEEIRNSVSLSQFGIGLVKALAFGALIALLSCRVGLRAGRSAADVGKAATTGVVAGVIGVITLDAIVDLCANVLDI